ncbi:MAG: nucleotide exchange factor GrpE [Candidatus Brocadiaceae bacterium]|nr:nucleotide exchange factor GrpE [Candidatus Brocadiaceae bacterium]
MNDDQDRRPQADAAEPARDDACENPAFGHAADSEGGVTLSYAQYEELKALAGERDEYLRRLQRAVADYQNLQKRVERFQDAARQVALRALADDFLPVADSLGRALEAAANSEGGAGMIEGLRLVEHEFYRALAGVGIRPIEAVGQPFNPDYHEAVLQMPVKGVPTHTVVQELKKGFLLGETLVRPAQVIVAAAPADETIDSPDADA